MKPGTVIEGKYRIDRVLGHGGMGIVVAAHHLQLDEMVAIKFLLPQALLHSEILARFYREAQAAAKIKGEHVARVLDVCESQDFGPFIVIELLDGTDLGKVLEDRGPLPLEEAVGYVLEACVALAEAHGRGIVHRDLKPANLFLSRRPDGKSIVKVLDFGISKMAGSPTGEITAAMGMLGSYAYMSPEQVNNAKDVDGRADVWSLGVVLFKLLTGEAPFVAETVVAFLNHILRDPPTPIRTLRPEIPEGIETIIAKCLEKDRADRFDTVAELSLALAPFAPAHKAAVDTVVSIIGRGALPSYEWLPPSSPDWPPGDDIDHDAATQSALPEARPVRFEPGPDSSVAGMFTPLDRSRSRSRSRRRWYALTAVAAAALAAAALSVRAREPAAQAEPAAPPSEVTSSPPATIRISSTATPTGTPSAAPAKASSSAPPSSAAQASAAAPAGAPVPALRGGPRPSASAASVPRPHGDNELETTR